MKKKTWMALLGSFSALTLLSLPLAATVIVFGFASPFADTFLGEMKDKMSLLKSCERKKIVFVGGSSLPFGIRSDLIHDEIADYQVVDFGMYASLGTSVMLDFAKANISKDDFIFIMPEQNAQTLSVYYNGQSLWQALDGHFEDLSYVSYSDKQRLVGDMYAFAQSKFNYLSQGKPQVEGIYQKSSFNSYGDIKPGLKPANVMDTLYDPTQPISFDSSWLSSDFVTYMNDFASFAQSKGAHVYYHFAPMNKKAVVGETTIDSFYDALQSQITFEISGNPHDSVLEEGWFYDTNFHLNDAGAIKYTKQLIKDIKLILADDSKTNITDPEMPEPIHPQSHDGDNTDEALFTYQEEGEYYTIVSYSGKKDSVMIPYSHNGKKIISVAADVFQKNTLLTQITFQDNISIIYDNTFRDIPKLEKIVLTNQKPSSIKIGYGLLDGTNANLYVPKDCLSQYKTNYNFAPYSSRIYALEE